MALASIRAAAARAGSAAACAATHAHTLVHPRCTAAGWRYQAGVFAARSPCRHVTITAHDMREGELIEMDGGLYRVVSRTFSRTAMGRAYVQAELRNIATNTKKDLRFRSEDAVERATLDTPVKYTVLYTSGEQMVVMNADTYEQTELPVASLGEKAKYLSDGLSIYVENWKRQPAVVNIPSRITAVVKEMDETGGTAVVEAGYKVRAPKHVKVGDKIVIDTNDGRYVSKE